MNLTRVSINKIKWILHTEEFRNNPFKIISKIFYWEVLRKLNRKISFKFDNDLTIFLYPNDGVARLTYYFGYHEPSIFKFLDSFLKEGMTYCDIGANIGLYSIFAAKRVGFNGKVFSFEPQSETYKRMVENINTNNLKNIYTENKAVGNKNGLITMQQNYDSAKSYIAVDTEDGESVEIITFDSFIDEKNLKSIDYLKIDVEGYEYNVLIGMKNFLKNTPPKIIQIELYENFLNRSGATINMVKTLFEDLNYIFFRLDEKQNKLTENITEINGDMFLLHKNNISQLSEFIA